MKKFLPGLICSVLLALAPQLKASPVDVESSDAEPMEFRNPAICLVPCTLNTLRREGPMAKPAMCKRDLQRLLVQIGQSPCKTRPALCEDWVDKRGGQIEVNCGRSSRDVAAAIISCLH